MDYTLVLDIDPSSVTLCPMKCDRKSKYEAKIIPKYDEAKQEGEQNPYGYS